MAHAFHTENEKVTSYVIPTFVNKKSKLYNISNEYNGVVLGSKLADEQFLYGKGAGRYPTASAVLSDISALQYNYNYEYRKSKLGTPYQLTDDIVIKVYISYPVSQTIDHDIFQKIHVSYSNNERKYIIANINLKKLANAAWVKNKDYSIIAFEKVGDHIENEI